MEEEEELRTLQAVNEHVGDGSDTTLIWNAKKTDYQFG
jgi:hypothetical protein